MTTQPQPGVVPAFTFADRCRKARELTGLSKEDFADRLGVTRHTVSNYEAGRTTRPQKLVLRQWALASGVDFGWLTTGTPSGPDGSPNRAIDDTGRYCPTVLTMAA